MVIHQKYKKLMYYVFNNQTISELRKCPDLFVYGNGVRILVIFYHQLFKIACA